MGKGLTRRYGFFCVEQLGMRLCNSRCRTLVREPDENCLLVFLENFAASLILVFSIPFTLLAPTLRASEFSFEGSLMSLKLDRVKASSRCFTSSELAKNCCLGASCLDLLFVTSSDAAFLMLPTHVLYLRREKYLNSSFFGSVGELAPSVKGEEWLLSRSWRQVHLCCLPVYLYAISE
eukprot:TRINITY_DN8040_c0_g1_i4.p1 TRINITY_DN8040_c0_g1~~TRINITY_DN8040_c0_g1_i4.p1  ORF type:complete len:178 (+),score=5.96 TRINITY_DN8040_c0_g1_i4:273-806(+)